MNETEDFDDFDVLDEPSVPGNGKLPSTLLALCILTFIGCAFILVKDLITFQFFEGDPNLPTVYLIEVISCLISIAGAILMLRLKLFGFYIYVISNIAYLLAVLWYWMEIVGIPEGEWLILIVFVYFAPPVGFIILYSTQKKYLK